MTRPLKYWVFAALVAMAGCQQGPGVGVDPFGRTTIPPPMTGAAARPSVSDPYYSGHAAAPPLVPAPILSGQIQGRSSFETSTIATVPADTRTGTVRPATWIAAGSRDRTDVATGSGRLRPVPSFPGDASETTEGIRHTTERPPLLATGQPADVRPVVFIEDSSFGGAIIRTETLPTPGADFSSPRRIEISELPALAPHGGAGRRGATGGHRFDHAADYTWLKGRLEYSASGRRWTLRYDSTDEPGDRYGGSVILPQRAKLEDFRHGDFVMVHGRLADAGTGDDAARYAISRIKRLD